MSCMLGEWGNLLTSSPSSFVPSRLPPGAFTAITHEFGEAFTPNITAYSPNLVVILNGPVCAWACTRVYTCACRPFLHGKYFPKSRFGLSRFYMRFVMFRRTLNGIFLNVWCCMYTSWKLGMLLVQTQCEKSSKKFWALRDLKLTTPLARHFAACHQCNKRTSCSRVCFCNLSESIFWPSILSQEFQWPPAPIFKPEVFLHSEG